MCDIETTYMFVRDGRCAVADHQYQHRRAEEKDDPKVKVVDSTHYERTVGWEKAASGAEPELRHQTAEADRQAAHQAPEGPLVADAGGR